MMNNIDKLTQQVVSAAKNRIPHGIDNVFDNQSITANDEVLNAALILLSEDIDTLAWLCAYFASEINSVEDNEKPKLPIYILCKLLIKHGLKPFVDFTPYTGCRITVFSDKLKTLPVEICSMLNGEYDFNEMSNADFTRLNDACLAEFATQ